MWIEVFRTGEHTDSNGNTQIFDGERLAKIADTYNIKLKETAGSEVPLIKGHAESGNQAEGWVKELRRNNDKLLALIEPTDNNTMKQIAEGKYRNVSVKLDNDNLRHIALLGAETPAVEGLSPLDTNPELTAENNKTENNSSDISQNNDYISNDFLKEDFRNFLADLKRNNSNNPVTKIGEELAADIYSFIIEKSDKEKLNDNIEMFKKFIGDIGRNYLLSEYSSNKPYNSYTHSFSLANTNQERLIMHTEVLRLLEHNPELNYEQALSKIFQ